jgi:hypothetical protein
LVGRTTLNISVEFMKGKPECEKLPMMEN